MPNAGIVWMTRQCASLAADRAAVLVRIRCGWALYTDPDPTAPGGPDGSVATTIGSLVCADPGSWFAPGAELTTDDPVYGSVRVQVWSGSHPTLSRRSRWADADASPIMRGSVIRVEVKRLPKLTSLAVKTLWLWWSGPAPRPRHVLAGLPAPFRHRAHLPARQEHPWAGPLRLGTPSKPTARPGWSSA